MAEEAINSVQDVFSQAAERSSDFVRADGFTGWVEGALDGLGLMRGDYAIPKRMGFGFGLGSIMILLVKPDFMFNANGSPREWSLFSDDSEATIMPWYVFASLFAFFFGVFI